LEPRREGTLNKLMVHLGVFYIIKDAYEFKYVIDGAFVNEMKQTLSNGTNRSENSV
jgi:hypothetical protein